MPSGSSTVVAMTLTPQDALALTVATKERRSADANALTASEKQYAAIRRAAKNGASLREIAEIAGMAHQMVHKIVSRP